MSKAILVMDMPKCCYDCVGSYDGVCYIENKDIDRDVMFTKRESYCPLREVPQKKVISCIDTTHHRHVKQGFNMCIDEILGGAE